MRAAICTAYGGPDVVEVRDVPPPVAKNGDVLIRVRATTVSSGDARVRGANFPPGFAMPARLIFGLTRPRQPILGTDLSGVVEAVGPHVTRFRPGDEVIAMTGAAMGCHAELRAIPESGAIALKPPEMDVEDAAAIPFGGTTALYFLKELGRLNPGERVLVNGASGAVGSAAVQLAKHWGAHVTAVCSGANADLVRTLGADALIDHKSTDFTATGETWDIILDTVGTAPFTRSKRVLSSNGRLLLVLAGLADLLKAPLQSKTSGLTIAGGSAPERAEDLEELARLCTVGAFKPVIGRRLPLERVAEAHALADTGRKVGNTVIVMNRE